MVPFDTEVAEDEVYLWKRGQRELGSVSCGGTDFNALTKWVNERQFDGHIVLTDMEALSLYLRCQRMWMTTQNVKDNTLRQGSE